jgi:hypothetical protein
VRGSYSSPPQKKLACSIYDSTNSWRDNATRHMHPYHRYMCRSAVPGCSTHRVHIVPSLSNASRDPPLSIYLDVTSRYIRVRLSLWRHLFTAEPPVYQRNQRRYHVKKKYYREFFFWRRMLKNLVQISRVAARVFNLHVNKWTETDYFSRNVSRKCAVRATLHISVSQWWEGPSNTFLRN